MQRNVYAPWHNIAITRRNGIVLGSYLSHDLPVSVDGLPQTPYANI